VILVSILCPPGPSHRVGLESTPPRSRPRHGSRPSALPLPGSDGRRRRAGCQRGTPPHCGRRPSGPPQPTPLPGAGAPHPTTPPPLCSNQPPLGFGGGVLTGRWGRRNYLFFTIVHEVAFPLCCILHGFTSPKSRANFMCLYTPSFDFPQSKWDGVISVIASVLSSSSCQATFFPPRKTRSLW